MLYTKKEKKRRNNKRLSGFLWDTLMKNNASKQERKC